MPPRWRDLQTKGFVHVPGFLSDAEMEPLLIDYSRIALRQASLTQAYDVRPMSAGVLHALTGKLEQTSAALRWTAKLQADLVVGGFYFATERVAFAWHQDHDSFYTYQQHAHYLNFYVPLIKPRVAHENVCVVAFDKLADACPSQVARLLGGGAKRFRTEGEGMRVDDDESGATFTLPVKFDDIAETPALSVGDLLLMRGDLIHRTQPDAQPSRVAASFRMTRADAPITRARLDAGCPAKDAFTQTNSLLFAFMHHCFETLNRNEITASELNALTKRYVR